MSVTPFDAKIAIRPSAPLKFSSEGWLVKVIVWTENNGAIYDWTKNAVDKLSGKMFPRLFPINALIGGIEARVIEVGHEGLRLRLQCSQKQMKGSERFEIEVKKILSTTLATKKSPVFDTPKNHREYVTCLLDKKVRELKWEMETEDLFTLDDLTYFFETAYPVIKPWLEARCPAKTAFIIKLCKKKNP